MILTLVHMLISVVYVGWTVGCMDIEVRHNACMHAHTHIHYIIMHTCTHIHTYIHTNIHTSLQVKQLILGQEGTSVHLIARRGSYTFDADLTRIYPDADFI
jgi:hypothetical protein